MPIPDQAAEVAGRVERTGSAIKRDSTRGRCAIYARVGRACVSAHRPRGKFFALAPSPLTAFTLPHPWSRLPIRATVVPGTAFKITSEIMIRRFTRKLA